MKHQQLAILRASGKQLIRTKIVHRICGYVPEKLADTCIGFAIVESEIVSPEHTQEKSLR